MNFILTEMTFLRYFIPLIKEGNKKKIKSTATDVGENFPTEARAMHYGEKEEKPIIGKTTVDEARDLAEEGIPFIPLPWSDDKIN